VRSFDQTHEFIGWNHGHRPLTLSADDHDFTIIRHTI
jgi:hypothetical protein